MHIFEATLGFTTLDHLRNADTERSNATHVVEGIQEYEYIGEFGKNGIAPQG